MGNGNGMNEMTIFISGYYVLPYDVKFLLFFLGLWPIIILIIEQIYFRSAFSLSLFIQRSSTTTHLLRIFIGFRPNTCDKHSK